MDKLIITKNHKFNKHTKFIITDKLTNTKKIIASISMRHSLLQTNLSTQKNRNSDKYAAFYIMDKIINTKKVITSIRM